MSVQHNETSLDTEEGARVDDLFRRATFGWAVATKRLVESSAHLPKNARVAPTALEDLEWASALLDGLFVPSAVKPPGIKEGRRMATASMVKDSVSAFAQRAISSGPLVEPIRIKAEPPPRANSHRQLDLSAPVQPKNGKMLWAGIDCSVCSAKATQRCHRDDGVLMEKPHAERKSMAETASIS